MTFPQLKSQAQIDREARTAHLRKFAREVAIAVGFAAIGYGLASMPATAEDNVCAMYGRAAASVMTIRQAGVPLSEALSLVDQVGIPEASDLLRSIVIGAYDSPMWHSDGAQARAVVEYRDQIEVVCFRSMAGGADQ